jgi:hypothetical protein
MVFIGLSLDAPRRGTVMRDARSAGIAGSYGSRLDGWKISRFDLNKN